MKRIVLLAVLLAIVFSGIIATSAAPAALADSGVIVAMVHGAGAHAQWNLGDGVTNTKGVTVDLWDFGGIGTEGPLGRGTNVEIGVYESAWNPYYYRTIEAWHDFDFPVYQAKGTGLESGSLVHRIPVSGIYAYPPVPPVDYIDVDITWTGTGEITRAQGREAQVDKGGLIYQCFYNVRQRNAVASGTIRIGEDVIVLDPSALEYAYLEWADPSGCVVLP